MLLVGCRVALSPIVEVLSPHMVTEGICLICLGTTISTPRPDKTTANSRDRYSYECRCWIVVRIDIPLATNLVSLRPSRLANVRYCLIFFVSSGMSTANKYTDKYTSYSKSITK